MPKVTIAPSIAGPIAAWIAAWKAATSRITWSAGITSSSASGPSAVASMAASVNAGAVYRPKGSSRILLPVAPEDRICSADRKRYSSLQTTIGPATESLPLKAASRIAVACSMVSPPTSDSNCLGYFSRDIGHRRVPEPPERMTG